MLNIKDENDYLPEKLSENRKIPTKIRKIIEKRRFAADTQRILMNMNEMCS